MELKLNGNSLQLEGEAIVLAELLQAQGISTEKQGIAVAVNWEVVPRQKWSSTQLRQGDEVEVITARQGG